MKIFIKTQKMNIHEYFSSLCSSIFISNITLPGFLKIAFFIIFIFLNIFLVYCEYKNIEIKSKINSDSPYYMQSGVAEIKKVGGFFVTALGTAASLLSLHDAYLRRQKEEQLMVELAKAKEESAKFLKEKAVKNMWVNLHGDRLDRAYQTTRLLQAEKTELEKSIAAAKVEFKQDDPEKKDAYEEFIKEKAQSLNSIILKQKTADFELAVSISEFNKYATEFVKLDLSEESQILSYVDMDIFKSSMIDIDIEKILHKFDNFESLNGLSQLMFCLIFSNYLVL
jgi:hypothetical protein